MPRDFNMPSITHIVRSTCFSISPRCAVVPPGSMLAVPDIIMRLECSVSISTALEKELPYSGAPHCRGD